MKILLALLNVFVQMAKALMRTTFVKMKTSVHLIIKAKRFVPMENVSIEILDIFAFVILVTYQPKIKNLALMLGIILYKKSLITIFDYKLKVKILSKNLIFS